VAPKSVLDELFLTLRRLVDGEVVQLRGRTEVDVRRATYFAIVEDKTASLFVWATRTGGSIAGAPRNEIDALGSFGQHMGVAFQLVDDLLDYDGEALDTGKAIHADLKEGKLTLPLVLAIERQPSLARDLEAARTLDPEASARLVAAVHAQGTCEEVRTLAQTETDRALEALATLPASSARDLLAAIAGELTSRTA
jgi:octaprenyl-diphosphate synthase